MKKTDNLDWELKKEAEKSVRKLLETLRPGQIMFAQASKIIKSWTSAYEIAICDRCGEMYSGRPAVYQGLLLCPSCAEVCGYNELKEKKQNILFLNYSDCHVNF
ncbi:MAG: hypothetical protein ACTSVI_02100 [Promethearchaeota archaeon]